MIRMVIFIAAVAGVVLSGVVHGVAVAGREGEVVRSLARLLEVGVMVMVGLSVLSAMKGMEPEVAAGTRRWLCLGAKATLVGVVVLGLYAGFNWFSVTGASRGGDPVMVRSGGYALMERGQVVRGMTEEEYRYRSAYKNRWASGNWMLFYCAAAMLVALPGCREE